MMWERCHELVEAQGSKVVLRSKVTSIAHRDGKAVSVTSTDASGATSTVPVDHVISSMPFQHLLRAMDPQPPAEVLAAADDLSFRDFLYVALAVPEGKVAWDDNWRAGEGRVGNEGGSRVRTRWAP